MCVTYLISGSISFLNEQSNWIKNKEAIYVTDTCSRFRRALPTSKLQFKRLSHTMVGGATTFEGIYAHTPQPLQVKTTTLKRRIGDFLDYSIPPSTVVMVPSAISHVNLLPVQHLNRHIHFPSHFSHNGFGYRHLTSSELLAVFGLPTWIKISCQTLPIPPVQWLTTILAPFLKIKDFKSAPSRTLPLPPIHDDLGYYTIPTLNVRLSNSWCSGFATSSGAAKSDSAVIHQALWDQRILLIFPKATSHHLDILRSHLMAKCCVNLYTEFKSYLCHKYKHYNRSLGGSSFNRGVEVNKQRVFDLGGATSGETSSHKDAMDFSRDLHAGKAVLSAYVNSSYMNWEKGSALIFWRWPPSLQALARDGVPSQLLHPLPANLKRQNPIKADDKLKLLEKLRICLSRGYLTYQSENVVKSYIDIFGVAKGLSDIRMVLNGASCGINDALFASNFWFPMSNTMTRLLSFGYRVVDVDLGEMFLNFPLDPLLRNYSGIDLSMFRNELSTEIPQPFQTSKRLSATWNRSWFGLKSSPEVATTFYYLAEEFIRGKQDDFSNPLRWDEVILNMIGEEDYNPSFPNVYKWDSRKLRIAGELIAYVDDLRALGFSLEYAWQIARRACSYLQYLGIQDAARKRRVDEGPWAGGLYSTSNHKITK